MSIPHSADQAQHTPLPSAAQENILPKPHLAAPMPITCEPSQVSHVMMPPLVSQLPDGVPSAALTLDVVQHPMPQAHALTTDSNELLYISENQVAETPLESDFPLALKAYEKAFAKALKADISPTDLHAACENYFSKMLIIKRSADRTESFWQHLEVVKVLDASSMLSKDVKLRHNAENCNVLLSGINPSRHNAKGGHLLTCKCKPYSTAPVSTIDALDVRRAKSASRKRGREESLIDQSKAPPSAAISTLLRFFLECSHCVSLTAFDHPTFRLFLSQVGLGTPSEPLADAHTLITSHLKDCYTREWLETQKRLCKHQATGIQGATGCWSVQQRLDDQVVDMPVLNVMWNHPHGGRHMYKQVVMPYGGVPYQDSSLSSVVAQQLGRFAQEIVETMKPSWLASLGSAGTSSDGGFPEGPPVDVNEHDHFLGFVLDLSDGVMQSPPMHELAASRSRWTLYTCHMRALMQLHDDLCNQAGVLGICAIALEAASFFSSGATANNALKECQLMHYSHTIMLQPYGQFGSAFRAHMLANVVSSQTALIEAISRPGYFDFEKDMKALRVANILHQREPEFANFWDQARAVVKLLDQVKRSADALANPNAMLSTVLPQYMQVREVCMSTSVPSPSDLPSIQQLWTAHWHKHRHAAMGVAYILDVGNWNERSPGVVEPPFAQLLAWDDEGWFPLPMKQYIKLQAPKGLEGRIFAEWQRLQYTDAPPEADYASALAHGSASPADRLLYWKAVDLEAERSQSVGEQQHAWMVLPHVAQRVLSLHASAQSPPCSPLCLERYRKAGTDALVLERVNMLAFLSCNSALQNDRLSSVSEDEMKLLQLQSPTVDTC